MRPQNQDGGDFEDCHQNRKTGQPLPPETRDFDRAENGDGRVPGKEEVVANVVGDG